jgi:hypothetical protein
MLALIMILQFAILRMEIVLEGTQGKEIRKSEEQEDL